VQSRLVLALGFMCIHLGCTRSVNPLKVPPKAAVSKTQRAAVVADIPSKSSGTLAKRLEAHVRTLAAMKRGWDSPGLEAAARYIEQTLKNAGLRTRSHPFKAQEKSFRNIIAELGPADAPLVVIGAHYDSFGSRPGADDNASGVAAMIELASRLELRAKTLAFRYQMVAWTLEEPPMYDTVKMGSYVHAAHLKKTGAKVRLAISLEMLGYYSDQPNSQSFPIPEMTKLYPTTGNFIALVGRPADRAFAEVLKASFLKTQLIPTETVLAPVQMEGIDFSDHRSFWHHGYDALMITDTSFYRNSNYHKITDTPDTLDYARMSAVVRSLDQALMMLETVPQTK
jgi:Zn-dependent M28 family amino/carboxypeptidase